MTRALREHPGWRGKRYRIAESFRLIRIWFHHLTFNQRAVGLLVLLLIAALIRSEVRVTRAAHKAEIATLKADRTAGAVKDLLVHQTDNRVKNVGVWCNHFVTLEGVLIGYVAGIHGAPKLGLHPLTSAKCHALEYGTKASTR